MNYIACESNKRIKVHNIDFENYKMFTYDNGTYTFKPENVLIKKFIYYVFPEEIILSISNVKHETDTKPEDFNLILSTDDKSIYDFIINNRDSFKILPSVFKNNIEDKVKLLNINDRDSLFNLIINCINTSDIRENVILDFKKNYYDKIYAEELATCRKKNLNIDNIKIKLKAMDEFSKEYPGMMIYFKDDYIIKNLGKYFPCTINCENLKRLFQFINQYNIDKNTLISSLEGME